MKLIYIVVLVLFLTSQTATAAYNHVSDYEQYKSVKALGKDSPYYRNLWYLEKNYDSWEHMKILKEKERKHERNN